MTRIIAYIIVTIYSIIFSFAQIKSEAVLIKNNNIELPGTLTYINQKTPLIIWVHGSGNIDRNGNQAGLNINANYIKQFRDSINKQNISFFSFDKRTSNPNNSNFLKNTKFNDFINDVDIVVNHFKSDKRFSKIILIGHSQGSLIAMLASKNVDKYISISGPSKSVDKAIISQVNNQNEALGDDITKAHFKELKETGSIKTVDPVLVAIFAKQNLAFMSSWIQYSPTEEIKKIAIPTLIINGTKDLQVKINNAKELHLANKNSKLILIENMNHVLKQINKDDDNLKSYYSADFPLSKKLIETVVSFVKK